MDCYRSETVLDMPACPTSTSEQFNALFPATKSRIFALVIAIDQYGNSEIPMLGGCKYDAEDFVDFLTESLRVPSSHTVFLKNEAATRQQIIWNIRSHFLRNEEIRKGDAIVFFYAGRGGRARAPLRWHVDGTTLDVICPFDQGLEDGDGNLIHGLPARTFAGLMRQLAHEKGNNITTIFDTSFVPTVSRRQGTSRSLPKRLSVPPLPDNIDQDIWSWGLSKRTAAAAAAMDRYFQAMPSHVVLAACKSEEVAFESMVANQVRGTFTTALVNVLRRCRVPQVTYERLSGLLPRTVSQHPQCVGINLDRLLFNGSVFDHETRAFGITSAEGACFVEAGSIHGVERGTEFVLEQVDVPASALMERFRLVAHNVYPLRCEVLRSPQGQPLHVTPGSRAVVSNWNNRKLKVHFQLPTGNQFAAVGPDAHSDVSVVYTDQRDVLLYRTDPLTCRHSSQTIKVSQNALPAILDTVAHFNLWLYRFNALAPVNQLLITELHRLRPVDEISGRCVYVPIGDDLLASDTEPIPKSEDAFHYRLEEVKEAVITDMDSYYGLTLTNRSPFDLFPYVFYFDPEKYSIQAWYLPSSSSPPLPCQKHDQASKLFIGYGDSSADTLKFSLPEGTIADSGFLKIFASTSYVDLESITRLSLMDDLGMHLWSEVPPFIDPWDAWVFVLTCHDDPICI